MFSPNLCQRESSNFIDIAFVFQLPIVILFLQIFQFNIANNFTTYKMNYINPEHMSMNKFYIYFIYIFSSCGDKKINSKALTTAPWHSMYFQHYLEKLRIVNRQSTERRKSCYGWECKRNVLVGNRFLVFPKWTVSEFTIEAACKVFFFLFVFFFFLNVILPHPLLSSSLKILAT